MIACAHCDTTEGALYPFGNVMLCSPCLNSLHHINTEIVVAKKLIEQRLCAGCGQPIVDATCVEWSGHYYHDNHLPPTLPPQLAVLRALRLIEYRARNNGREEITLGDIEWAIQEIERG